MTHTTETKLLHLAPALHIQERVRPINVRVEAPAIGLSIGLDDGLTVRSSIADGKDLWQVGLAQDEDSNGFWVSASTLPDSFTVTTCWELDTHPWVYKHRVLYTLADGEHPFAATLPVGLLNEHKPCLRLPLDLLNEGPGLECVITLPDSHDDPVIVEQEATLHTLPKDKMVGPRLPDMSTAF